MFRFALHGTGSQTDFQEAEQLLAEWNAFYESRMAAQKESSEGSERNGSQKPKVDEASEEEKDTDEDNAAVGLGVKGSKG